MEFQNDELIEILNIFRVESEEIVTRLNDNLMALEKSPANKDLIILLFRDAHSLKGASRMIGFTATQNLAHKLEDTLGLAKEDKLAITPQIADVMYKTVDLISKIIEQSIETGKEKFSPSEVDTQTKELENIGNLQKTKEPTIEVKEANPNIEAPQRRRLDKPKEFSRANLIKYYHHYNSTIIKTLKCVIKLSEKIENNSIKELLSLVTELLGYFEQINHYDIKSTLETIKLKLDIIEKCNTELTLEEVAEIQQAMDNIINQLTNLCEINNLETIDYYGYAFGDEEYEVPEIAEEENNVIEPEIILDEEIISPKIISNFNIEDILGKIKTLETSSETYEDLEKTFKGLKESNPKSEITPVLDKILSIIEFTKKLDITLDESVIEILSNATRFCYATINGERSQDDSALLAQQLTVARQLVELANPQTTAEIVPAQQLDEPSQTEQKPRNFSKMKDFTKIFDTGEIKTLHVESSKLDAMVSQIGELIATKIKTTKQLGELNNLNDKLEDWQKDFSKLIRHMKSYDKRFSKQDSETDTSSIIFIKQMLNTLTEQSKKLNSIASGIAQTQRSNIEDDMKMRILIDDFDGMIKNIRVLPLATVFHLFGRMVRDIAHERGKEVELTITGSETSVDKKIIEEIKNPLIHIIRNSIDHGIETPERRRELGKNPTGHIQINAKHLDNKILIEVIDDGQGFNIEKIKEKALNKGFLTAEEISDMSDEEIMNIVFYPGFTTGDEVTSISGRGIGMDVVKSKIAQLNGTVKVVSEFNVGSKIQIELPVTMATLTAFLIQSANQTFALPMSVINTVVCRSDKEIYRTHESLTILHNGKNIPVYNLAYLLNLKGFQEESDMKTIIIIETNNKVIGIIVNKLLGEQEILHKKLSPPLYRIKNISGVTTLATGETCLILNAIDLIKNSTLQNAKKLSMIQPKVATIEEKKSKLNQKNILVIDDSITTRTLEKNILSSAGFNVITANNPIDALKKINEIHFDIILTDIEMPEMSGLEFLSQMKTNELYADVPIVVMSSLGDESQKRKAHSLGAEKYVVKGEFNQKAFVDMVSNILLKYSD